MENGLNPRRAALSPAFALFCAFFLENGAPVSEVSAFFSKFSCPNRPSLFHPCENSEKSKNVKSALRQRNALLPISIFQNAKPFEGFRAAQKCSTPSSRPQRSCTTGSYSLSTSRALPIFPAMSDSSPMVIICAVGSG